MAGQQWLGNSFQAAPESADLEQQLKQPGDAGGLISEAELSEVVNKWSHDELAGAVLGCTRIIRERVDPGFQLSSVSTTLGGGSAVSAAPTAATTSTATVGGGASLAAQLDEHLAMRSGMKKGTDAMLSYNSYLETRQDGGEGPSGGGGGKARANGGRGAAPKASMKRGLAPQPPSQSQEYNTWVKDSMVRLPKVA
jgi:hypothetical protein